MKPETVILTQCECGWLGVASSLKESQRNFHSHQWDTNIPNGHVEHSMAMSNGIAEGVIDYLRTHPLTQIGAA